MRLSLKHIAIALTLVFAATMTATLILAAVQILPDWERSSTLEPYEEQWTAAITSGMDVEIDLSLVSLVVLPTDSDTAQISFSGKRSALAGEDRPTILVTQDGGALRIRESSNARNAIIRMDFFSFAMEGTLTLRLPAAQYGMFTADTFSGGIAMQDVMASSIELSTSSGDLRVSRLHSDGKLTLTTFSGSVDLVDSTAGGNLVADASSGSLDIRSVEAQSLTAKTFSGGINLTEAQASGVMRIDTSSGSVNGESWRAGSIVTEQFSGGMTASRIEADADIDLSTSSGSIHLTNIKGGRLMVETFSGDIMLSQADVGSLKADTSSGRCEAQLVRAANANIETFSGEVALSLPQDAAFIYELSSFSGSIHLGADGMLNASDLRGERNGGGETVYIKTSSGNISLLSN